MSNLTNQVSPLTKGILWLAGDLSPTNIYYKEIDYLLDGLLTASLEGFRKSHGQLVVGENFGSPFYVMIVQEPRESELLSFLHLIKKNLRTESNIIVIDEKNLFEEVRPFLKDLTSYFKTI
jgi:hypothetical protein